MGATAGRGDNRDGSTAGKKVYSGRGGGCLEVSCWKGG